MELDRDDLRNQYEWSPDFWTGKQRCKKCRGRVDEWTEDVPCCGAPYECVDTLYVYACHHCRLIGDSF